MRFVKGWAAAAATSAFALAACGEAREVVGFTGASSGCATCHSAPDEGPPFRDAMGETNPALAGVGAHDAHLRAQRALPLECGACHRVPRSVSDPGHVEDLGAGDVVFAPLAAARGASATFDGSTCAAYCHGQFPGGKTENRPSWVGGPAAGACGTCHPALGTAQDPSERPTSGQHTRHLAAGLACDTCHGPILQATHVNGVVNLAVRFDPVTRTCQECHGPSAGPWTGG